MSELDHFAAFIASHLGCERPRHIETGRFMRFPTNGKRDDDAGYAKLFPDCRVGIVGDFRTGESWVWHAESTRGLVVAESAAVQTRVAQARRQAEEERERELKTKCERARAIWEGARPAQDSHPYLVAKGVKAHGLRVYHGPLALANMRLDGALAIPAHTSSGDLVSLSFISPGGEKRYLAGPKPAGAYFQIGEASGVICIAEGYATGASVYEATGHSVAVAFDAGNLEPVARALRAKYPEARLVICADNDTSATGQRAADAAALSVNGSIALPSEPGADWNDVHRVGGVNAVRGAIAVALKHPSVAMNDALPPTCAPTAREPRPTVESKSGITVRRMSDVQARPIQWLWPGKIARGKLTLIAGNPGLGKSQITASLAAIVSAGSQWPGHRSPCERGSVFILSAEDDAADTIRPRLEATGADLDRVHAIDVVREIAAEGEATSRTLDLTRDIVRLDAMLAKHDDATLLVIDPISAYIGGVDSHRNADVRSLLSPLAELAARHGIAVVAVSHLNKGHSGEALMRVTGSLAFVAAARAAFVVVKDDNEPGRRLFLPLKNNLSADQTGLAFHIEPITSNGIETSRVSWESQMVTVTADEALAPKIDREDGGVLDEAKDFLLCALADGPILVRRLHADAEGASISRATLRRAKEALGVQTTKTGMKDGWAWQLPPKMLTKTEYAQAAGVSTFDNDEHLREPDPHADEAP